MRSRRILEINLLIIGALIFVGIGIAALQSDSSRNAALKSPERTQTSQNHGYAPVSKTSPNAPMALFASLLLSDRIMLRTAVLEFALPNYILTRATTLAATRQSLHSATPRWPGTGIHHAKNEIRWVMSPHPLAVPVAFGHEPIARDLPAVFTSIPVAPGNVDRPAPLVRLNTRTGTSPFWFVMSAIMLVTFALGFRNSRKAIK